MNMEPKCKVNSSIKFIMIVLRVNLRFEFRNKRSPWMNFQVTTYNRI